MNRARPLRVQPLESRTVLSVTTPGPEFRVNTTTYGSEESAHTIVYPDGEAVVAWSTSTSPGLLFRRFNEAGSPLGGEQPASVVDLGDASDFAMSRTGANGFLLAWRKSVADNRVSVLQKVARDGTLVGGPWQIADADLSVSIAAREDGRAVIVTGVPSSGHYIHVAQVIGQDGIPLTDQLTVSATSKAAFDGSSAVMGPDGTFVVAFVAAGGLYLRYFDAAAQPTSGDILVRPNVQSDIGLTRADDGSLTVAWSENPDLYFRRYDSTGTPLTPVSKAFRSFSPSVDSAPNGDFILAGQESNGRIFVQRFSASGLPLSAAELAHPPATGSRTEPSVALDADGGYFAAWTDSTGNVHSSGISGSRFRTAGDAAPPLVSYVLLNEATVSNGELIGGNITDIRVRFSEPLAYDELGTVSDPSFWRLAQDGVDISNVITQLTYYPIGAGLPGGEARLTLSRALGEGQYELQIDSRVADTSGNRLDGDGDTLGGDAFVFSFDVGDFRQVQQRTLAHVSTPNVAMATGQNLHVAAWDRYVQGFSQTGGSIWYQPNLLPSNAAAVAVAVNSSDDTLVTWRSTSREIRGQFIGPTGQLKGGFFTIHQTKPDSTSRHRVAALPDGSFVVIWDAPSPAGTTALYARKVNAQGLVTGAEFSIDPSSSWHERRPEIAVASNNTFAVISERWSAANPSLNSNIVGRWFNASGQAMGTTFIIAGTIQYERSPSVAVDSLDRTIVAWQRSSVSNGEDADVYFQAFDQAGHAVSSPTLAHLASGASQREASLTLLADGRLFVGWLAEFQDPRAATLHGRLFRPDLTPESPEFRLEFIGDQQLAGPTLLGLPNGRAAVAWLGQHHTTMAYWSDLPTTTVQQIGLGTTQGSHPDYLLPTGSGEQLRTVPVARLDKVSLQFSREVSASIADLTVRGESAQYSVVAYAFDAATRTATWQWAPPVERAERLTLALSPHLLDSSGAFLDGDWENPIDLSDPSSSLYSGDGAPGGTFALRINVLPGDANRDNLVSADDLEIWVAHYGQHPGDALWTDADFTGDGRVTGADYTIWADNFGIDQTELMQWFRAHKTTTGYAEGLHDEIAQTLDLALAVLDSRRRVGKTLQLEVDAVFEENDARPARSRRSSTRTAKGDALYEVLQWKTISLDS